MGINISFPKRRRPKSIIMNGVKRLAGDVRERLQVPMTSSNKGQSTSVHTLRADSSFYRVLINPLVYFVIVQVVRDKIRKRNNVPQETKAILKKVTPVTVTPDHETTEEAQMSVGENTTEGVLEASTKDHITDVLCGNATHGFHTGSKVVRLFASSTFTDTNEERNILMEKVYPRIRRHCQRLGYQFNVVDMRWGIRDAATDDHSTLDLCLEEIKTCQHLSTGISFVSLLAQKYGYRPLPAAISQTEFEVLLSKIQSVADVTLLQEWYARDDNHIPPAYVLQPVSSILPDSEDTEGSRNVTWSYVSSRLTQILRKAVAATNFNDATRRKYFWSITDAEIEYGLSGMDPAGSVLWFNRTISDLDHHEDDKDVVKFVDKGDEEARNLLETLKKRMYTTIPKQNIFQYEIRWDRGLSPGNEKEHYLEQLCQDFYREIVSRVDQAIQVKEQNEISLPVYEEVVQHLKFAHARCQSFFGRGEQLKAIREYLQGNSRNPLVVYGQSGSGKTSVMSKAFTSVQGWLPGDSVVIVRYLGTTPASSGIRKLIISLCQQLTHVYGQPMQLSQSETLKVLQSKFLELLEDPPEEFLKRKVVIFLDSLDQLSEEDKARELDWMPFSLPDNVKLVVSTLPDNQYLCLPILKSHLTEASFVEVPALPTGDAEQILQNWMAQKERTLTGEQTAVVLDAFTTCSLPIFLRISIDHALKWKSYTPSCETRLQTTVRGAIESLFRWVERRHGRLLVSRALAYITAAKTGLTETELEDILSCDDEVLEDVFQYWIPPVRRFPPLLWLRIKRDLSIYLVDRGSDDATVVTWYHRQFLEAATERYLADEKEKAVVHSNLADYFLGTWSSGNKKPFKSSDGHLLYMDRLAASQPISFNKLDGSTYYNLRKLGELPYHLIRSKRLDVLKRDCLCHYEFLLGLLKARSFQDMLDVFDLALEAFENDMDLAIIRKTLKLSNNALSLWPGQLSSQLLSRLPRHLIDGSVSMQHLEEQARKPSVPALIPNQTCLVSPGGALVDSLSGPVDLPSLLRTSDDGTLILAASVESGLHIWATATGKLLKHIKFQARGNLNLALSEEKDVVVVSSSGLVRAWHLHTGQLLYSQTKGHHTWITNLRLGTAESIVCIHDVLEVIELRTGNVLKTFSIKKSNRAPFVSIKDTHVMIATRGLDPGGVIYHINIFDLKKEDFVCSHTIPCHGNVTAIELLSTKSILFAKVRKNSLERARISVASASNCIDIALSICDLENEYATRSIVSANSFVRIFALTKDKTKMTILCDSNFVERNCEFQAVINVVHIPTMTITSFTLHYPSTIVQLDTCGDNLLVTSSLDKILRVWDIGALRVSENQARDEAREEDFHVVSVKDTVALLRTDGLGNGTMAYMIWHLHKNTMLYFRGLIMPSALLLSAEYVILLHRGQLSLYETKDKELRASVKILTSADERFVLHALSNEHVSLTYYTACKIEVYEIPTLEMVKTIPFTDKGEIFSFTSVAGSSERFAVGLKANKLDTETKECFVAIATTRCSTKPNFVHYGHLDSNFDDLCISENGSILLDVVYDSRKGIYRVAIWNVESRNQIFISPPSDPCHVAALSNSGQNFLAAHWDGTMSCWAISPNGVLVTPLWKCSAHAGPVHKIFLSVDGCSALTIAGGFNSKDRSLRLWDCKGGTLEAEFTPDVKISSLEISSTLDLVVVEIQDQVVLCQVSRGWCSNPYSETPVLQLSDPPSENGV